MEQITTPEKPKRAEPRKRTVQLTQGGFRILRQPAVCDKRGCGKTTLYADIKAGLWTEPVHLGPRCSAWPEFEADEIIAARIAGATDDDVRQIVNRLMDERRAALPNFTPSPGPAKKARSRDARGRLK